MTKSTSPLRQRMIDDLKLRNMSALTQAAYIRAVKNLSQFFGRSPDQLTYRIGNARVIQRGHYL